MKKTINDIKPRPVWATFLTMAMLGSIVAGCKLLSAPPTETEHKFFDIATNVVPQIVHTTNAVNITNYIPVFTTNELNQIVIHTNEAIVPKFNLIDVTNFHEEAIWTLKTNAVQMAQTAGTLGNMALPGFGGLISGILVGIGGIYGRLRQSNKTGGVLVQNVEAILTAMGSLPNGDKYVSAFKQFLMNNQNTAGVISQVGSLIADNVDDDTAKIEAAKIRELLTKYGVTVPPPPA